MNAPIITDRQHLTFAQALLEGLTNTEAYQRAYPTASKKSAVANAARLRKRKPIQAWLDHAYEIASQNALESTLLTVLEKRQFLARIVRTPITALDPENPDTPNSDIIKTITRNETETSSSTRIEKLDPLKAIQIDNDLAGQGTTATSLQELAQALQKLNTNPSPIPTGKL